MNVSIVLAFAALSAAGSAFAQDLPPPPPSPFFHLTPIPGKDVPYSPSDTPDRVAARRLIRAACAADMHGLCQGKTGAAADRCLVYHRLSFSRACRQAITGFERAAAPIGAFDTLEALAPYSRGLAPPSHRRPQAPRPGVIDTQVGTGA